MDMMARTKWMLLFGVLLIGFGATFLLEGGVKSGASGDLSDPYLDPYAMTLAHRHAGAGSETAAERAVSMRFDWTGGSPEAGQSSPLALKVTDGNGKPVESFDLINEKLIHLVVVSADLQQFQHVHPEYRGSGVFELPARFPAAGEYRLYADFMPSGMNELTRQATVNVGGELPAPAPLTPSASLAAEIAGMRVELSVDGELKPLEPLTMTYTFTDAKSGEAIRDLELYLGAVGHVVGIDEGLNDYLHLHPLNWASPGPQAVFGVSFPRSGLYKLWGQFQRNGEVLLVPFVVEVG